MTDRSIKLFKDFTAEDLDGARVSGKEHWMKFTRPGDGVEGPAAELVDSEETARRKLTEAVARDKREYSDLNQKKELIDVIELHPLHHFNSRCRLRSWRTSSRSSAGRRSRTSRSGLSAPSPACP